MQSPTSKLNRSGEKISFLLLMLALTGCSRQIGSSQATVRELVFDDHCRFDGAVAIQDMNELLAALGTDPGPIQVDFQNERVLALAVGQRRTAGYRMQLAARQAKITERGVLVRVREQKPSSDSMVAQVLTTPCLVIAISKGVYAAAEFVDETGLPLGRIELKSIPPQ